MQRRVGLRARVAFSLLSMTTVLACTGDAGPTGIDGPTGPAGPTGPPGPGTTPSISFVYPLHVFVEHTDTVLVSGSGTAWDAGTTLELGPGITVDQVVAPSPTALFALVTVDSTAALGSRTLSVVSGPDTLTFSDAFSVRPPIVLDLQGSPVPGGHFVGFAHLKNQEQPFPVIGQTYEVRTYLGGADVFGQPGLPTSDSLYFRYFLPLDIPPGSTELVIEESLSGTKWRAPVEIGAADIEPAAYGGSTVSEITEDSGARVHRFDAQPGQMIGLNATGRSISTILPSGGREDVGNVYYASTADTLHLTVYGDSGAYTLSIDTMTITPPEIGPTPVVGGLTGILNTDVYSIPVDVGETVTVTVSAGPTDNCTVIDAAVYVRDPTGAAVAVELGGCAMATTFPLQLAGTYTAYVTPNPECLCTFDYSIAAVKN